jgi:hypothetical protein
MFQSLGQNSKIISSLGPDSQIVLLHNSISFIGKGRNGPQEIAPQIFTHFNFQYFYSVLGTLRDISTIMKKKKCQENMHWVCNNNVSITDETLQNPTCKYPRSLT